MLDQMKVYDYRGFALVEMPNGAVLIHNGTPEGTLAHQATSLEDATRWVDAQGARTGGTR